MITSTIGYSAGNRKHSLMKRLPGVFADYERMKEENGVWREGARSRSGLRFSGCWWICIVAPQSPPARERDEIGAQLKPAKGLIYIHHHFREDLRLEDALARPNTRLLISASASPNPWGSLFNVICKTSECNSPNRASGILAPVTEICYASGFNTLGHFERVFRQRKGMSPPVPQQGRESRRYAIYPNE